MATTKRPAVPTLALNQKDASTALGVSENFFHDEIAPLLPCVSLRSKKLYPVTEIQKWLDRTAVSGSGAR